MEVAAEQTSVCATAFVPSHRLEDNERKSLRELLGLTAAWPGLREETNENYICLSGKYVHISVDGERRTIRTIRALE